MKAEPKAAATPQRRGRAKSINPGSRRVPVIEPSVASEDLAPPPISRDPRATLRDLPGQKSAAQAARAATAPRREDEISIPPTSGEPPADLDDRFFAEGEASAHHDAVGAKLLAAQAHLDEVELRHAHADVAVPPERRQKLANYVKGAVGFCAVLCLAAVVRVGFGHVAHASGGQRSAAAAQVAAISPPADPILTPAAAIPPPPPAEEPVAVAADPASPAKTAKEEKEDARAALEHGKRDVSIEAATRSVALDPTDAEAWLILGSAQQDSGHWKEGRESYVQCTKQATVGPVVECKMMLR